MPPSCARSLGQLILERLNWEPTTSLETGMAKTYAWIRDRMTSGARKDTKALVVESV